MTNHISTAYTLALTAIILMVINVFMSARVAQDGLALDQLIKKQAKLKTEITLLEQQRLNNSSLQDLSIKAAELGYQEPVKTITITVNHHLAQY